MPTRFFYYIAVIALNFRYFMSSNTIISHANVNHCYHTIINITTIVVKFDIISFTVSICA